MKLFALRAADYMKTASSEDRRYLLFNPIVKMKVTTQGEEVINLLWDVIAAKGFEQEPYFSMAAIDIRGLPKLEGTVHVNMALIIKFMAKYFFATAEYPEIPRREDGANDDFLFDQGPTRGLGAIKFHDYRIAYDSYDLPNLNVFKEQVALFKEIAVLAPPTMATRCRLLPTSMERPRQFLEDAKGTPGRPDPHPGPRRPDILDPLPPSEKPVPRGADRTMSHLRRSGPR